MTLSLLTRLNQLVHLERDAQLTALRRGWERPLSERVALGRAIEGLRLKSLLPDGNLLLECQTNESRFREGDLLVLLLHNIIVNALEAQVEMRSNWNTIAENCLQDCQLPSQNAMLDKAALLPNEALRNRLAQGKDKPCLDALLETNSIKSPAHTLVEQWEKAPDGEFGNNKLELLRRYVQRIAVEIEQERS